MDSPPESRIGGFKGRSKITEITNSYSDSVIPKINSSCTCDISFKDGVFDAIAKRDQSYNLKKNIEVSILELVLLFGSDSIVVVV